MKDQEVLTALLDREANQRTLLALKEILPGFRFKLYHRELPETNRTLRGLGVGTLDDLMWELELKASVVTLFSSLGKPIIERDVHRVAAIIKQRVMEPAFLVDKIIQMGRHIEQEVILDRLVEGVPVG